MAKNKEHSARPKGDRRLCFERVMRRLAAQAVPSPNPVGFYHCGAAIGSLITKVGLVTYFYFEKVRERVCFYLFKSIESIASGGQPQGLSLQTVGNEQFKDFMPLTRQRCVEVTAPYMLRVNKFVQISQADDIRSYCELFHYSLLLITLNEAKQTPQSLCDSSPSGAPEYIL